MLFNSYEFIFVFLPITLLVYHVLCKQLRPVAAISALIVASLVFYAWWEPRYLVLILLSVFVNFAIGEGLIRLPSSRALLRKSLMIAGVVVNLGALAWFKYANFLVDSGNAVLGTQWHLQTILLPLAISFFTFQQIAYIVDTYRSDLSERSFLRYALFVSFFPQLIAGPIVHHKEMLPQFSANLSGLKRQNLVVGSIIFFIGLFKKVIIADGVAPYSDSVFALAAAGQTLSFLEAWTGALAYSLQLYFDFSGYSDMAIGLARLFGVCLPLNFNSPYKSHNIIDFWRRWHMTLSRFLRDYLYFSLGGNRHGNVRTYINLMLVMLLGGLWHGAGWTFVLWGGLHGVYLLINHAWRHLRAWRLGISVNELNTGFIGRVFSHVLTLLAVIVAWVVFRAESLDIAGRVLAGMAGLNGVALPVEWLQSHAQLAEQLMAVGINFQPLAYMGPLFTPLRDIAVISGVQMQVDSVGTITALSSLFIPIVFALWWPNTQELMHRYQPTIERIGERNRANLLAWRMSMPFALLSGAMAAYACFGGTGSSQFLYFQF